MTELLEASVSSFRGGNWNDPPQDLWLRSHTPSQYGWSHSGPWGIESSDTKNTDIDPGEGIRKRLGSTENDDIHGSLAAGESTIIGIEWQSPVTRSRIEVWLTTVSIWTNQSGSFAKLTAASGTEYNHAAAVTKGSFTQVGGHLVIGMDGANPIQTYRNGAALDEHLNNMTAVSSTVDADSNSGQKVLNVAATTDYAVFDRITINSGGGREESGYIDSIQAGVSVTMKDNLTNTHTAAQADEVIIANRWTEAFGGTQTAVLGNWSNGYFIVGSMHSRLVFGKGDGALEYTATEKPYDRANGGVLQSMGTISGFMAAAPEYTDSLKQLGYIFSERGIDVVTGFTGTDDLVRLEGRAEPMNHRSIISTGNWVMYMTRERRIMAINASREVDVGRRFKNNVDAPLDGVNIAAAPTTCHAFYNNDKKQAMFFAPTGGNTTISDCLVLDMQQGEPFPNESESEFEKKVSPFWWQLKVNTTSTTVDVTSNSGQKVLSVAATTAFAVGNRIIINSAGAREEWGKVASISAGASITLEQNLKYQHTLGQADEVLLAGDWFVSVYQALGAVYGVLEMGISYTLESGNSDMGDLPIEAYWKLPPFHAGVAKNDKQWIALYANGLPVGDWLVTVSSYTNRDTTTAKTDWTYSQNNGASDVFGTGRFGTAVFGGTGILTADDDVELYSRYFQFQVENNNAAETFRLTDFVLSYAIGAEERYA